VTAQVVSEDAFEMVQQGQTLYSLSNRLVIKVPMSKNGLEALHLLSRQGIPTMATAVFHPRQALMAALAGANYIAPYLGRMEKAGLDPWSCLKTIFHIFQTYRIKTRILGASLQTVEQVVKCAEAGIWAATVKDDLFEKLIETDPLTSSVVDLFSSEWKQSSTAFFSS
jgi:transaldolase